ncbi:MAG: hypothetical protein K6G66_09385 [Oscillospiraceae bacterium]|nr:hypothetical protein [Oscillospiraceae bacterium]
MKLREQWNTRAWPRVLLAFAVNAVFLTVMLKAFAPMWETNDDLFISKFFDGQMAHKTAFAPFLNICLGFLMKTVYTALGDGFNWYSAAQYLLLYLGFTAVTWVLLRRYRLGPALVMTAVLLFAFGTDCCLSMNFSKPAAAGTVGGMCLMLQALRNQTGKTQKTPLALGILLALGGFVWRFEEFGVCALLMACACPAALFEIGRENRGLPLAARLGKYLRYLAPFVLLAALAVGLFAVDLYAWRRPAAGGFREFNDTRSLFLDFQTPDYAQMPEVYDSVGMDESFVYMMKKWSFYDTERFNQENLETLIAARDELIPRRTLGECLGIFLNECLFGFTQDRPFAGFALLLAVWLACGKRRAGTWVSLGCMAGLFGAIYLVMIWSDRYLANRVDIGLFLAMAVVLSLQMDALRLRGEKLLLMAVLMLSLFITWRANRAYCWYDRHNTIEDKSAEKAAVARLLEDDEHLYLVKIWAIDHVLYTPLETPPAGFADTLVLIGGWSMGHPEIERILKNWNIENPYRDMVNRDDVCLIDHDILHTITYLRGAYYPKASAELVQPLSKETGLKIYRIKG